LQANQNNSRNQNRKLVLNKPLDNKASESAVKKCIWERRVRAFVSTAALL